ncbi:MAG: hypothetical protein K9I82_02250 [Chitinophagaceae bacterium]|nr:hypothetical protein [Chitinophagaceae bacterium]
MIKKMKNLINLMLLSVLLQSCNTLTHSEKTHVRQFAASTKNIPQYAFKFHQSLSNVRKSRGVYFANTLSTPSLHLNELDSIYAQHKLDERKTILFLNSFEILSTYSKILLTLSSDVYVDDLYNNVKELEYNLESLIKLNNTLTSFDTPTGFINIGAKIGVISGRIYLNQKQSKEIKILLNSSDTLITNVSNNIISYLDSKNLNDIINNEDKMLSINYLSYIQQTNRTNITNDLEYIQLKSNVDNIKQLRKKLIICMVNLKDSHEIIVKELNKKNSIVDNLNQLKELARTVIEINQIIKELN